jgi:hypothetical protein
MDEYVFLLTYSILQVLQYIRPGCHNRNIGDTDPPAPTLPVLQILARFYNAI